jgi:hypothetical protein
MIRIRTLALGAVVAAAIAACNSSSSPPQTAAAPAAAPAGAAATGAVGNTAGDTIVATEILVNVINNRIPPGQVTVWVVGPSIGRMVLGNVGINQTQAFTFKAGNLNGDYRLIAQGAGGGELPSQKFNLTPTLRFVQWSLDVNSIVQYATPK